MPEVDTPIHVTTAARAGDRVRCKQHREQRLYRTTAGGGRFDRWTTDKKGGWYQLQPNALRSPDVAGSNFRVQHPPPCIRFKRHGLSEPRRVRSWFQFPEAFAVRVW